MRLQMKALVVYFSQSGQTKKVADAIFEALTCDKEIAELGEVSSLEDYDLSFIGFPVIVFGPAPQAKEFMQNNAGGKKVALFVTHAAPKGEEGLEEWLDKCREAASGTDLHGVFDCQGELAEQIAEFLMKSDNPMLQEFGRHRPDTLGQPDEASLARAGEFARQMLKKVEA
jgi:flavodoxin